MHEGNAEILLQPLQFGPHSDAQERVQRRQRLVQQQDLRLGDQGARQRDALLLAAGELRRNAARKGRHVHQGEELHRLGVALGLADTAHLQREGDVVAAIEMRKQCVALEHHRGAAAGRRQVGDVGGADEHVTLRDALMAGNHAQRRRLAAARRTQQTAVSARRHAQVDAVHRGAAAVALHHLHEFESRTLHAILQSARAIQGLCQGSCAAQPVRRRKGRVARLLHDRTQAKRIGQAARLQSDDA